MSSFSLQLIILNLMYWTDSSLSLAAFFRADWRTVKVKYTKTQIWCKFVVSCSTYSISDCEEH